MNLLPAQTLTTENAVHHADLFTLCNALPSKSVDMILCDLPYGTTACSWDTVIPFEPMWKAFKRVIKPKGAIVLTASQPFTSALVISNLTWFRFEWVWEKTRAVGFLNAAQEPLKAHEQILVFSKGAHNYFPQGLTPIPPVKSGRKNKKGSLHSGGKPDATYVQTVGNFPRTVLRYGSESGLHPTQKPVALFRYLIRTYTQAGELVLDPTCGSGTTALAAREEGRRFVCGDLSAEYVAVARKRLAEPYTLPMFAAVSA